MTESTGEPGAPRTAAAAWRDWQATEDPQLANHYAAELTRLAPTSYLAWFEAGLLSKALGRWAESVDRNRRAVELFTPEDAHEYGGVNPAAWNLGVAATAVGDWPTARYAWAAYGISGLGEDGPIDLDLGMTPIRINPDRPSLDHQVLFDAGGTEVVWCWRRSPAHAVIASVPLPDSGHRFGDILLHDGEPKGTRVLGGREVSVFDELTRLVSSGIPTWQAVLSGVRDDDLQVLADQLDSAGMGLDEWSGMQALCAECSHGSPGAHNHPRLTPDETLLGLAGEEAELRSEMEAWLAPRPDVTLAELTLLW